MRCGCCYLNISVRRIDIETLAEKVSERYNVSVGELRSGGRRSETRGQGSKVGGRVSGNSVIPELTLQDISTGRGKKG